MNRPRPVRRVECFPLTSRLITSVRSPAPSRTTRSLLGAFRRTIPPIRERGCAPPESLDGLRAGVRFCASSVAHFYTEDTVGSPDRSPPSATPPTVLAAPPRCGRCGLCPCSARPTADSPSQFRRNPMRCHERDLHQAPGRLRADHPEQLLPGPHPRVTTAMHTSPRRACAGNIRGADEGLTCHHHTLAASTAEADRTTPNHFQPMPPCRSPLHGHRKRPAIAVPTCFTLPCCRSPFRRRRPPFASRWSIASPSRLRATAAPTAVRLSRKPEAALA